MKAFATALAALGVILNKQVSAELIEGYCVVLSEYPEDTLVASCQALAKSSKWFPKPIEFIDLIERGELPNSDIQAEATRAWGVVQKSWSNCSQIAGLCRQDGRIAAGIDALGGWYTMVNCGDRSSYQRHTFIQAFVGESQHNKKLLLVSSSAELKRIGEV